MQSIGCFADKDCSITLQTESAICVHWCVCSYVFLDSDNTVSGRPTSSTEKESSTTSSTNEQRNNESGDEDLYEGDNDDSYTLIFLCVLVSVFCQNSLISKLSFNKLYANKAVARKTL